MNRNLIAVALCAVLPAHAADVFFTAGASNPSDRSFWDIATNWSTGTRPGAADDAILGGFEVVHRSGGSTVNSFSATGAGTLTLTERSLAYLSNSHARNFVQTGGTLSGSAQFSIDVSASLAGGTHFDTGTTLVGGGTGSYTVGNMRFDGGRTLRNVGTLTQTAGTDALVFVARGTGAARFSNEGTFNVTTGEIDGFGGLQPADVFRNSGTINKTGAGLYSVNAPLDHRGIMNISDGTLVLNANATLRSGSTTGGAGALLINGTVLTVESAAQLSTANVRMDAVNSRLVHGDVVLNTMSQTIGTVDGAGQLSTLGVMTLNGGTHS